MSEERLTLCHPERRWGGAVGRWLRSWRDDFDDLIYRLDDALFPDRTCRYVGRDEDGNFTWEPEPVKPEPEPVVEVPAHVGGCFVDHTLDVPGVPVRHWIFR